LAQGKEKSMGEQTIYQRSPDAWQKIEKAGEQP